MDKKKMLLGFALALAFVFAFFFYSQQVTAQQSSPPPARVAAPKPPPAPPVQGGIPQFATIKINQKVITSVNGKESVVKLYTQQEYQEFLRKYKEHPEWAPFVLEITFSPTVIRYAVVCRPSGGKMICQ
jgi:hypothetical protein